MRASLRFAALLALLAGTSCARCSAPPAIPDAGAQRASRKVTELRTAVFSLLPRAGGFRDFGGRAAVIRRLRWSAGANPGETLASALKEKGLVAIDGGTSPESIQAVRPPFEVALRPRGQDLEVEVALPLRRGDLAKLLQNPTPLTSEHLALYAPSPAGAQLLDERFHLEVRYQVDPEHAEVLLSELTARWTGSGWTVERPDGGATFARLSSSGEQIVLHQKEGELRFELTRSLLP